MDVRIITTRIEGQYRVAAYDFYEKMREDGIVNCSYTFPYSERAAFAQIDNQLVGMITFNTFGSTSDCTICLAYVAPDHRNSGLATRMMMEVEHLLRAEGVEKIYLHAVTFEMQELAKSLGYANPTKCMTKWIK